jgi:hypothetical protein
MDRRVEEEYMDYEDETRHSTRQPFVLIPPTICHVHLSLLSYLKSFTKKYVASWRISLKWKGTKCFATHSKHRHSAKYRDWDSGFRMRLFVLFKVTILFPDALPDAGDIDAYSALGRSGAAD